MLPTLQTPFGPAPSGHEGLEALAQVSQQTQVFQQSLQAQHIVASKFLTRLHGLNAEYKVNPMVSKTLFSDDELKFVQDYVSARQASFDKLQNLQSLIEERTKALEILNDELQVFQHCPDLLDYFSKYQAELTKIVSNARSKSSAEGGGSTSAGGQ